MSLGKKWLCNGLAIFFTGIIFISSGLAQKPAPVTLPEIRLATFADVPPPKKNRIKPNLTDTAATVDKAINYKEVQDFLGIGFSSAQKEFLNRNKFLLIPKSATRYKGQINIYANKTSEEITVIVSDTGIGIEKSTAEKLFDNSEIITTKGTAKEKGSGLGLLICREFIEIHKGKIWVESEPGKGSDFIFSLPFNRS